MRQVLVVLSLLVVGCPSKQVVRDYQAAREAALAQPGPLPAAWEPDAALWLAPRTLDELVAIALARQEGLQGSFEVQVPLLGAVRLEPDLSVEALSLASTDRCSGCLAIDATVEGPVAWRSAVGHGEAPLRVRAKLDAQVATQADEGDRWTLGFEPKELRHLEIEIGGAAALAGASVERSLGEWVEEHLLDDLREIDLGTVGSESLPLRAARVADADRGLAVALLTRSPSPTPLPAIAPSTRRQWELFVSTDSLLDVARARSFEAGPVYREVVVEPRSLDVSRDGFEMGIRLWRPVGRGWWRDYTVTGSVQVGAGGVDLTPTAVSEGARSKGARVVDPLAALGEGVILEAIESSLDADLPSRFGSAFGGVRAEARVVGLTVSKGVVHLSGRLQVEGERGMERPPKRGPGGREPRRPR